MKSSGSTPTEKILVFRPGLLGDTIVTLPSLHLIARAFPEAEKRILTYKPLGPNYPSVSSILCNSRLVDGFFDIDATGATADWRALWALRKEIAAWNPQLVVYLARPRKLPRLLAEVLFFRSCGIRRFIGVPWRKSLRDAQWLPERRRWEQEAERFERCLAPLGDPRLKDRRSWDLGITDEERSKPRSIVARETKGSPFIVYSVGAMKDVKDWGVDNWCATIERLNSLAVEYSLVGIGGVQDHDRAGIVGARWRGRTLNLCGELTPRETAALMESASLYVGHDTGPMHLAAAVGTPCVAVFSAQYAPGHWFPYGEIHRPIYHKVPCFNCRLEKCVRHQKRCITSITVDEVISAVKEVLAAGTQGRKQPSGASRDASESVAGEHP